MNDSGFITTNVDIYGADEEPWKIYSHEIPYGAAHGGCPAKGV